MARSRRSQPPRGTAASLEQADLRGQCQVLIFQLHAGGRAPGHRLSPSKRAIIATGLPHEVRWVRTAASCGSMARRPCRDGSRHARCARRGARGQGAGRSAAGRRLQHLLSPRPTDWGQHDRVEAAGDWTSRDPAEMSGSCRRRAVLPRGASGRPSAHSGCRWRRCCPASTAGHRRPRASWTWGR